MRRVTCLQVIVFMAFLWLAVVGMAAPLPPELDQALAKAKADQANSQLLSAQKQQEIALDGVQRMDGQVKTSLQQIATTTLKLESLKEQLATSKTEQQSLHSEIPRIEKQITELAEANVTIQSQIPVLEEKLNPLEKDEADILSSVRALESSLSVQGNAIAPTMLKIEVLETEKQARFAELRALYKNRNLTEAVQLEIASELEKEISQLAEKIGVLRITILDPQSKFESAKGDYLTQLAKLNHVTGEVALLISELASNKNKIQQNILKQKQLAKSKTDNEARLAQLVNSQPVTNIAIEKQTVLLGVLSENHQKLNPQLMSAKKSYDDAQVVYKQKAQQSALAVNNHQAVLNNIETEKSRLLTLANKEGLADGDAQAKRIATPHGSQAGLFDGTVAGRSAGMVNSEQKSKIEGFKLGSTQPTLDSMTTASYEKGLKAGKELAIEKAEGEQFPKGFNELIKSTLEGDLEKRARFDLTKGDAQGAKVSGNIVSTKRKKELSVSEPTLSTPKPNQESIPKPKKISIDFPGLGDAAFSPTIEQVTLPSYAPEYRKAYEEAFSKAFEDRYLKYYTNGYKEAFNKVVEIVFEDVSGKTNFDALNEAKVEGAFQKGKLDGFEKQLPISQKEQYQAGSEAFKTQLAQGSLIRVHTAGLVESNGDGVFSPGETIFLEIELDNLGGEASREGQYRVVSSKFDPNDRYSYESKTIPVLPGNTRSTLLGAVIAENKQSPTKKSFSMKGSVQFYDGSEWTTIANYQTNEVELKHPIELIEMKSKGAPTVGKTASAVLVLKNLTNKTIPAQTVGFDCAPQTVKVESTSFDLPEMAAGEVVEVEVSMTPLIYAGGSLSSRYVLIFRDEKGDPTAPHEYYIEIDINRIASLNVLDSRGRRIKNGKLFVRAGSTLTLNLEFDFHATKRVTDTFSFKHAKASDGIKSANNSTTGVSFPGWSPERERSPTEFHYEISEQLKGKKAYIMFALEQEVKGKDGKYFMETIHQPFLRLEVE